MIMSMKREGVSTELNSGDRLMKISPFPKIHGFVTDKNVSRSGEDDRQISGTYMAGHDTDVADDIVNKVLDSVQNISEPVAVLKQYQQAFMRGRSLDVRNLDEEMEGETSAIYVSRTNLLTDTFNEMEHVGNLRFPLEICFFGETAQDLGGPRKEFFELVITKIQERFLTVQNDVVTLLASEESLPRHEYYYAGLLIGLSTLEGGPLASFLSELMEQPINSEERTQLLLGLERTGVKQLIDKKTSIKFLFMRANRRELNVNSLLRLFDLKFAEEGSSLRVREEKSFRSFVKYTREVYAGKRQVNLGNILRFATGASMEPVLGFTLKPTIVFTDQCLPTANTCIGQLQLPREVATIDRLDLAFANEYFGYA